MPGIKVASTEFQNRAGRYLDQAAKEPVFITRHSRTVRVLLDIDEYERLKANDARKAFRIEDLPDEAVEAILALGPDDFAHLRDEPELERIEE